VARDALTVRPSQVDLQQGPVRGIGIAGIDLARVRIAGDGAFYVLSMVAGDATEEGVAEGVHLASPVGGIALSSVDFQGSIVAEQCALDVLQRNTLLAHGVDSAKVMLSSGPEIGE